MSAWRIVYLGVTFLSVGTALASGIDAGFIVAGIGAVVCGLIHLTREWTA